MGFVRKESGRFRVGGRVGEAPMPWLNQTEFITGSQCRTRLSRHERILVQFGQMKHFFYKYSSDVNSLA
jgi:hypothetical protein